MHDERHHYSEAGAVQEENVQQYSNMYNSGASGGAFGNFIEVHGNGNSGFTALYVNEDAVDNCNEVSVSPGLHKLHAWEENIGGPSITACLHHEGLLAPGIGVLPTPAW